MRIFASICIIILSLYQIVFADFYENVPQESEELYPNYEEPDPYLEYEVENIIRKSTSNIAAVSDKMTTIRELESEEPGLSESKVENIIKDSTSNTAAVSDKMTTIRELESKEPRLSESEEENIMKNIKKKKAEGIRIGNVKLEAIVEILPNPDSVYSGDEVYLFCSLGPEKFFNSILQESIEWFYNGVRMEREEIPPRFNSQSIIFDNVQKKDAGNYSCQWRSDSDLESPPVTLKVNDRPPGLPRARTEKVKLEWRLLNSSKSVEDIHEGDFVNLICDLRDSSLTILQQSLFYGIKPALVVSTTKEIKGKRVMISKNITKTDGGRYICLTFTKKGEYSVVLDLNVKSRPVEDPHIVSKGMKKSPESMGTWLNMATLCLHVIIMLLSF